MHLKCVLLCTCSALEVCFKCIENVLAYALDNEVRFRCIETVSLYWCMQQIMISMHVILKPELLISISSISSVGLLENSSCQGAEYANR